MRRAASTRAASATMAPAAMSECPLSSFVAECSTTSKPKGSGRNKAGLKKVLSMTEVRPRPWQKLTTSSKAPTRRSGLEIDST